MTTETAEPWDCTDEEYHADSKNSISRSELDTYRKNPRAYHDRYVSGVIENGRTPALDFGAVFHDAVLYSAEDEIEDRFVIIPPEVLSKSGSRSGGDWKEFKAEHPGKILMKESEYAPIEGMMESLKDHPVAWSLCTNGMSEYAIRWVDEETGVKCRCKIDKVNSGTSITDLKTCVSAAPGEFAKHVLKFGYHYQADWYRRGYAALTGDLVPFVFVAIEKTAPYRVETYELDEEWLQLANAENTRTLLEFSESQQNDHWHPKSHGKIFLLSAPRFAAYQHEYTV